MKSIFKLSKVFIFIVIIGIIFIIDISVIF